MKNKDFKYQLIFTYFYDTTCIVKYFKNDTTLINFLMKKSNLISRYDITDMTNLKRVKYDFFE